MNHIALTAFARTLLEDHKIVLCKDTNETIATFEMNTDGSELATELARHDECFLDVYYKDGDWVLGSLYFIKTDGEVEFIDGRKDLRWLVINAENAAAAAMEAS